MSSEKLFTLKDAGVDFRFQPDIPLYGDWEGLKISNYQRAGEYAAERIKHLIGEKPVLEVCAGIGGTTFVLARTFTKAFTVDLNPMRLQICAQNMERLGLSHKIEFIQGDILDSQILKAITGKDIQAIYTDVDFTLTDDWQNHTSDITQTGPNTQELYAKLSHIITPNICMKLPKTINIDQLRDLGPCEIEIVKPDGKHSFYLIYFGALRNTQVSEYSFPRKY